MMKNFFIALVLFIRIISFAAAQDIQNNPRSNHANKFEQLATILPSPNDERTASGAPGSKYWQQRTDYDIKCELDERNKVLTGTETVTLYNNSPDQLNYIWIRLDENKNSNKTNSNYPVSSLLPANTISIQRLQQLAPDTVDNGNGFMITKLVDIAGKKLDYDLEKTMMRVELPAPLKPNEQFVFHLDWTYKLLNHTTTGSRGGYEFFPDDKTFLFSITNWYPRLCLYNDYEGWQNHQFTGKGEFALAFGNFKVQMTVPANHIVGATGVCQNYSAVLNQVQLSRFQKAAVSNEPIDITTLTEAKNAVTTSGTKKKTWVFQANNVRDFAWTSSPRFIWDAMGINISGKKVMCMSFYGKEAYPLYHKFSTRIISNTIKVYSDHLIPYPYPVAQGVEAALSNEYPMISFNFGRPATDGTYSEQMKTALLTWETHSIGHQYFPEIINTDESQWTWMDEGMDTFFQNLAEELWDNKFPSEFAAYNIVDYMKEPKNQLEPIMTNSESIIDFHANAYSKVATALNILRETILGRKRFDYAFKVYAERWAFKQPTPADFFRTMNDASGEYLDWFWRGWFFTTDHCDISLDSVKVARPDFSMSHMDKINASLNIPVSEKPDSQVLNNYDDLTKIRNRSDKSIHFYVDQDTSVRDLYWYYDRGGISIDTLKYKSFITAYKRPVLLAQPLTAAEQAKYADKYFYELHFTNKGGLVMPLIVEFTYKDGTKSIDRTSVEIWRLNEKNVTKVYILDKEVKSIRVDPYRETADTDEANNYFDKFPSPVMLQVYRRPLSPTEGRAQDEGPNLMEFEKAAKSPH